MSIKLVDNKRLSNSISLLENVDFINNEEEKYFKLSDAKGNEIRVEYIPQFISSWNPERYEVFLFENQYLTAENDIFEIYESTVNGRLGWIFPIASLDSNDNNYVDDKIFKNYRFVAYWKLLNLEFEINYTEPKQDYSLSDIFPNLFILLISKDEVIKIDSFKIENYILSFLKFDYLLYNGSIRGKMAFDKADDIDLLRKGNHRLKIKKSTFDISKNQYTKSLFIEHLYQTENFLIKYIFLYQILEHFIEENGEKLLDELIRSFQEREITKNTLKEKLSRFDNDRSLLKKSFEIRPINKDIKKNFTEKCTYLFQDIGESVEGGFEDILYDLRNLITHRYRSISHKTNELKGIIIIFESLIIELLINYNVRESVPDS